ncbi:spore germination protein (amino acid permease) [Paenibacillus cellulosilyticus]|uniref:Spore germination protein (Amino acid permease) n=1 Tax=Paenibacillus cellulosilyticus TaxID=375489 RepID=A0A2V2YUF7_9BACL|nr:endospore germination permease [Paenibacillus cellulosilyticus]PWV99443.1 spore germination protein (amino acid permease) [Paenibacillus cellulosilyticus]QKS44701.1 endospore germination permease [Paenibacillus cellulosilyticus]
MKKYKLNEITMMQYIMFNSGMAVSFAFIDIPTIMANKAGTDGWIPILIGGLVTMLASVIIIQLMKRYPDGTLFDLLTHYVGRWAGITVAAIFTIYFLLFSYVGIVYTVRLIKGRLLIETPAILILVMLMIPTYTIARSGLRIIGRYAEFVVFISLYIPFIYIYTYKNMHPLFLLPILKDGWQPVLSAVPSTFFGYIGFVSSIILYPFLKNKKQASAAILISNGLTMLAYLFITLVCFVSLSPDESMKIHQPTIYVLKSIELSFIEQVEGLFIAFYTFIFSMSWIPTLFMMAFSFTWIIRKQDHRPTLRAVIALIVVSMLFFFPTYDQLLTLIKLSSLLVAMKCVSNWKRY